MRHRLLAVLLVTGCHAKMISSAAPSTDPNAPVNEGSRLGLVSYKTDGAGFVREKRREHAYKQMHESCGGPYRIVSEGDQVEGGVVVAGEHVAVSKARHVWYIQYACVAAADSAQSVSKP